MDTRRLFKEDVYLKTAKAVITDIQREEENLVLILDQTIFFPEGGGQSSDIGTISDLTVTHVYEDKDYIYHRKDTVGNTSYPANSMNSSAASTVDFTWVKII